MRNHHAMCRLGHLLTEWEVSCLPWHVQLPCPEAWQLYCSPSGWNPAVDEQYSQLLGQEWNPVQQLDTPLG